MKHPEGYFPNITEYAAIGIDIISTSYMTMCSYVIDVALKVK
ncbi:MAG: hypothetical protein ACUVQM_02760 [Candidatus Hadarchaeaceae archaeon]